MLCTQTNLTVKDDIYAVKIWYRKIKMLFKHWIGPYYNNLKLFVYICLLHLMITIFSLCFNTGSDLCAERQTKEVPHKSDSALSGILSLKVI